MKKLVIVLSILMLLAVSASAALAAPPDPKAKGKSESAPGQVLKGKRHAAAGVVANKGSDGFDVVTKKGNIHVTVNANTKFVVKGKSAATFADVVNGLRVNAHGTRDANNGIVAKWVHVIPSLGRFGHSVGTVVAFTANTSITVHEKKTGQDRTFTVNADTRIELPDGHTAVQKDDVVTVVAATLDSSGKPIARSIVVHGADTDKDAD